MAQFTKSVFLVVIMLSAGLPGLGAETGKSAAMKYFTPKAKKQQTTRGPAAAHASGGSRLLSISMGSLISSKSYQWEGDDFLGWNIEAAYLSEGDGWFGQGIQLEMQKFAVGEQELAKVALLFSLTFPRRLSFPVYLGVAAGPGFFLKQTEDESDLTFDYKAYVGLRLNQPRAQYFLQSGVKNHLHVLSDGQFIGWFVSSGVAYKF